MRPSLRRQPDGRYAPGMRPMQPTAGPRSCMDAVRRPSGSLRLAMVLLAWPLLAGCRGKVEDSAAFRAACHGDRLGTVERRNAAMEDGYAINRQFDCIEQASFVAVEAQKARDAAARTPEAVAQQQAQWQREEAERRSRTRPADDAASAMPGPPTAVARVDANSAPEAALAAIKTISPEVAAQIVEARNLRPFRDWGDLVTRVIGLRAAQPAMFASMGGLTVDGQALQDAAPPAGYLP